MFAFCRDPLLHVISCTELRQKWGKTNKSIMNDYHAVQIKDLCHIPPKHEKKFEISDEKMTEYLTMLLDGILLIFFLDQIHMSTNIKSII